MSHPPQRHEVACADATRIGLTIFEADSPAAIVIIAAAAAVKQAYYREFAQYLADGGLTTVTFDYRGIGDSPIARGAGRHVRMSDWGAVDLNAVIRWAVGGHSQPIRYLGHSIGAHLICLAEANRHVERALLIGAASGGWRNVHPRTKLPAAFFGYALGPVLARVFDPFPARKLRLGEDTPSGAVRQLASWTRSKTFVFADLGKDLPDHRASLEAATTLLMFSDEDVVTAKGSRQFAVDARLRHFVIETIDVHGLAFPVGHRGMFKSRCRDASWPRLLARLL